MNNIIINAVTAVCLAALCWQVFLWIAKLFTRDRNKRIMYLDRFKKGQFAIVYLTALPLYVIGFLYSGEVDNVFRAIFKSVAKVVELVVLKYEFDEIEKLMNDNAFYERTVYFCFVMAAINLVFVAFSVLSRRIWEMSRKNKIRYCPKDRLFIFGSNPRSLDIYNSDKERTKIIVDKISDDEREIYYKEDISYLSDADGEDTIEEIFRKRPFAVLRRKLYERFKKDGETARNIVIINTENDERNAHLCRRLIEKIDACDAEGKEELFKTLRIFVFGDLEYEAVYEDIVDNGSGCITFINKYKKIGADFIEHHPLALYMNRNHIDYQTSFVKKGVDINVFMICFGKVGRQIFLTSVANNQFITEGESGPELKKVKYHIFDKEVARNNKNLNHSYYRYSNEKEFYKNKKEDYLPLPSEPAEEHFYHLDINDGKLYDMLKNSVKKGDANFVVISFGNDLENIDMAQKLVAKRREWGQNFVIFVRTHKRTKEQDMLEADGCIFIGDESNVVYNIKKILSDRIMNIAIMRNEDYDLEYAVNTEREKDKNFVPSPEFIEATKYKSFKKWHTMNHIERESNLYAALSMRAKLNLMGLDYCDASDEREGLSYEYYLNLYAKNDMPERDESNGGETVSGRKMVKYSLDFLESRRKNMAILEHFRWNSYYISRGYVPASIEQIKNEKLPDKNGIYRNSNGKNHGARRHGNLTTFKGLVDFRKIVAQRDKKEEKDKDVIKYDYQILDDIYYFITASGYKIVKKENKK